MTGTDPTKWALWPRPASLPDMAGDCRAPAHVQIRSRGEHAPHWCACSCGTCGNICPSGDPTCCAGLCTNLNTSAANCGACAFACTSIPDVQTANCVTGDSALPHPWCPEHDACRAVHCQGSVPATCEAAVGPCLQASATSSACRPRCSPASPTPARCASTTRRTPTSAAAAQPRAPLTRTATAPACATTARAASTAPQTSRRNVATRPLAPPTASTSRAPSPTGAGWHATRVSTAAHFKPVLFIPAGLKELQRSDL